MRLRRSNPLTRRNALTNHADCAHWPQHTIASVSPIPLAIAVRLLANTAGYVFQKKLTANNIDPGAVSTASYFAMALAGAAFIPFLDASHLDAGFWIDLLLAGSLDALGSFLLLHSVARTDLSILGPLNALKGVVAMAFAVFILGERPTIAGAAGAATIVAGCWLLAPRESTRGRRVEAVFAATGVWYRIGSLCVFALGAVYLKRGAVNGGTLATFSAWAILGLGASALLGIAHSGASVANATRAVITQAALFLALVPLLIAVQLTTIFTFRGLIVGYALSIFQLGMLLQVVAGRLFLGEPAFRKRLIATVVMTIGTAVIAWFG
jgi:drug/metabolite transporter (DMT)-like permease